MATCLLGPPVVEGGAALAPRDRAVLAVLAVRRCQVVMPDQVADAVWGEQPPASWATQVQICVGRLRKVLGAEAIETIAGGYRLALSGDEVDLDRFEELVGRGRELAATGEPDRAADAFAKGLALWRGHPFEDLDGWEPARSEAARLEELRRSVEEESSEARMAAGNHREVAVTAEALVAAEPLRERRWAILALAQYRCNRQADALRSLARARRLLIDQLGIEPGADLVSLESAILRQDPALAAPEQAPPLTGECPYKGLAAYDVDDADAFFGRGQDIAACLERLRSTPLLVVAGPSGCGKSSLTRAGLLPALARGGRSAVVIVPGGDADEAMSAALGAAEGTPVLVIDQFEGLFIGNTDADANAIGAFLQRIVRYARQRGPVVICVRADHLSGLSIDADLARLAEVGLYLVGPLSGTRLREAIEQPAIQAGYRFEGGLVDLLLRDTEGEPGALPLLSHALVETWMRRDGHVLTVEGYRQTGGIRGAVARSADRLYDHLPAEQRAMLRGVLMRLVTPSVDGDPVRCRVPTHTFTGDRQREQLVAMLVRARLVTAETDCVELAHEALARAWPRLRTWLDEDAAGLRILRHLATTSAGWDTLGRPDSELYRGARLDTALEWRATTQPDLTAVETVFLDTSIARAESERAALEARARRDARQNGRLRGAIIGVALFAVASLVAGLIAIDQRQRAETNATTADAQRQRAETNAATADTQRRLAEGRRRIAELAALTSQSVSLRADRPDLAALLAAEAHRLAPSAATESALFGLFTAAPGIGPTVALDGGQRFGEVLWLPDGQTIAVADLGSGVRLIDVATGQTVVRLGGDNGGGLSWLSVSRDGHYLAQVITSGTLDAPRSTLAVWDLRTSRRRFTDVTVPIDAGAVAIDADGTRVAVAGGFDGRTLIYDAVAGELQRELETVPRPDGALHRTNTVALEFAPDGRLIVTSQAGPIRFVDPETGGALERIDGYQQTAESDIIVSLDGASMTTIGVEGVMRYALPSGAPIWPKPIALNCDLASAPIVQLDALLCLTAGRLVALDLGTGTVLGPRFNAHADSWPLVSPDGTTLLAVAKDTMTSWRLDGGGLIGRLLPRSDHAFVTEYSPSGDALMVNLLAARPHRESPGTEFVFPDPAVEIVDARSGDVRARLDGAIVAHFTDDADRVVARFDDDTLGWYDLVHQRRVGLGVDVGFAVQDFVMTGHSAWAWSEFGLFEGRIARVDLDSGAVAELVKVGTGMTPLDTTPSGQLYTLTDTGILERRDPVSDEVTASLSNVDWMVAGKGLIVAASYDGDLLALDPSTLTLDDTRFPPVDAAIDTMALSDDDRRLLVVGNNRIARLYDVASRTRLGGDIAVDVAANATFLIGPLGMNGAAIRGDGQQAAITTDDGIVVWDLDSDRWSAAACDLAGRNLTQIEWDTYVGDLATYHETCPDRA